VNFIGSTDKRGHSVGSLTVVAGDLRETYICLLVAELKGKCNVASIGETVTSGKLENS